MDHQFFINTIEAQYRKELPFVVYRKPNEIGVKAMLQDDDTLFSVENYSESGFVFAPFNAEVDTVLIPSEKSLTIECKERIPSEPRVLSDAENIQDEAKIKHINLVELAVKAIEEDLQFQKVVISRNEIVPITDGNPFQLFKRLLNTYKTAFVYCWYHPKVGFWMGATPETLIKVQGNRFSTMALAGTQRNIEKKEVVWGEKEKVEQQLVTDFIVENLSSNVSHLSVSESQTVKAGSLLHLKTNIYGALNPENSNLKEVIEALHPTPAVCGLPKERAKAFILENENYNRDFYTGFLGELNLKEKTTRNTNRRNIENNAYASIKTVSNLFVNLRCMQIIESEALIYVGGGITKDSIAEKEWEETVNKTETLKNIL